MSEARPSQAASPGEPQSFSASFDFSFLPDLHHFVCIVGLVLSFVCLLILRTKARLPPPTPSSAPRNDGRPSSTTSPVLVFMRHSAVATMLTFLFQHLFIDIHHFIGRYILSSLQGPLCHASVHLEFSSAIVHFFLAGFFATFQYLCALHSGSRWTRFIRKKFSNLCEWIWCLAFIVALPVCWYTGSHAGMCFDDGMEHLYGYQFIFVDIVTSAWLLTPVALQLLWLRRTSGLASALKTLWRSNRLSAYYATKWTIWTLPLCLLADYSWHHNHVNVLLFAYDGYLLSYAVDVIFFAFFVEEFRDLLRTALPWLPMGRADQSEADVLSPASSTSSLSAASGNVAGLDNGQSFSDDESELLGEARQQPLVTIMATSPNVHNMVPPPASPTPIGQLTLVQIS